MKRGHTAPVSCAASSPDERLWASGSYDRRILLWDPGTGEVVRALEGHTGLVNGVHWAPDGTRLASASSDGSIRLWDARSGRELARLTGHTDDVNAVCWSPEGGRLASASFDGTVRVWRATGDCVLVAGHHGSDVNGVVWLPDGRRLAAASDDRTVSVFDAEDGRVRRVLNEHRDWVDQVAVDPSGRILASAGLDGTVRVWDHQSGTLLRCLDDARCSVKAVAWSRDGSRLATSSYDATIREYEHGSWKLISELRAERLWNRTLAPVRDGWLTGSFGGGPVLVGSAVCRLGRAATAGLNGVAVDPAGRRAVACSDDGSLYHMDLVAGEVTGVLGKHDAAALCVVWSPDGSRVASGGWDRSVRIWDPEQGTCVTEARLDDPVNTLAFDSEGRRLWIGTFNGLVFVWDLRRRDFSFRGRHDGSVKWISASAGGAVSVGRDGWVRRWEADRERRFRAGDSILNSVALDPNGGCLATVSRRNGIELWSPCGERLAVFRDHPCSAKSVAWSPDGQTVAAVYYDGHLCLWDLKADLPRIEKLRDCSLSQVVFSPQGLLVSTWDARGTLLSLDPHSGQGREIPTAA